MKTLWTLSMIVLMPLLVLSQDVILLKNTETVNATAIEVLGKIIRFKNLDITPQQVDSIEKSKVYMIRYQNGKKVYFDERKEENTGTGQIVKNNRIENPQRVTIVDTMLAYRARLEIERQKELERQSLIPNIKARRTIITANYDFYHDQMYDNHFEGTYTTDSIGNPVFHPVPTSYSNSSDHFVGINIERITSSGNTGYELPIRFSASGNKFMGGIRVKHYFGGQGVIRYSCGLGAFVGYNGAVEESLFEAAFLSNNLRIQFGKMFSLNFNADIGMNHYSQRNDVLVSTANGWIVGNSPISQNNIVIKLGIGTGFRF